jgi:WD40 repeat protein
MSAPRRTWPAPSNDDRVPAPLSLAGELKNVRRAYERKTRRPLNVTTLARSIAVARSTLYGYLRGTALPNSVVLDALLRELAVDADTMRRIADLRDRLEDLSAVRAAEPDTDEVGPVEHRGPATGPAERRAVAAPSDGGAGGGWAMAGSGARGHFLRRARGQRSRLSGGDLFRGRTAALAAVRRWMSGDPPLGRPGVITGDPGAGKSAVLARAVLQVEAAGLGPGLAIHARRVTFNDVVTAIAASIGLDEHSEVDAVVDGLEALSGPSMIIAVDALDEVVSSADRHDIADLLTEVARLPRVRVVVATRPLAMRNRFAPGSLLDRLGVTGPVSPNLVDLDTDRYFDPKGVQEFSAAVLMQAGAPHPGPAGGAWAHYRTHPDIAAGLAELIEKRANRNYLVAALAATNLSVRESPVRADEIDAAEIPATVGEAITKYLDTLPTRQQTLTLGLLTALAYARGDGIDADRWSSFATALNYPHTALDLDELGSSPAADYLLQTTVDDGQPVIRLFHQALVEDLLVRRGNQRADEQKLLRVLLPTVGRNWVDADTYARTYAAEHAHAAGQLTRMLRDTAYLAVADLPRLRRLLPARDADPAVPMIAVLRGAAHAADRLPPARRARLFALSAAHLGLPDLRDAFTATGDGSYRVAWAHSLGAPHQQLPRVDGPAYLACTATFGGVDLVVCAELSAAETDGDWDKMDSVLRLWDAAGHPVGEPLRGRTGDVKAMVAARLDGTDLVITGGHDGVVRTWAADWRRLGQSRHGHAGIWALAAGRLGGRDVIVSGHHDGALRIWDSRARPIRGIAAAHRSSVISLAVGEVDGRELIVSGGFDGAVRLWDADGDPVGEPWSTPHGPVRAVAIQRHGDRDRIVSAGDDGYLRMWDRHGKSIGESSDRHDSLIWSIAVGRLGGREIIATAGNEGSVRLWDADGDPLGEPITEHQSSVDTVTISHLSGRDLIVSTDGTVRLWDGEALLLGKPRTGHAATINALRVGRLGGRDVLASAADDGTARLWSVDGSPIGAPPLEHRGAIKACAVGRLGRRDVVATGGQDGRVRLWNAEGAAIGRGFAVGRPSSRDWVRALAIGRLNDKDVIVVADENRLGVFDARGSRVRESITGHTGVIWAVAVGRLGGEDRIVSAGVDRTIRLWDAGGNPVGKPVTGHTEVVRAVAVGVLDGRDVIVSGSWDGTVRIWDADGRPIGDPLRGHTGWVQSVAIGRLHDNDVIVSAGHDRTVRVWDPTARTAAVLDVLHRATAVTVVPGDRICAATHLALCMWSA